MTVSSATDAIKIAKEVINEAGYTGIKITSTDYDEDDDIWVVYGENDDTNIEVTIDAETGKVTDFSTG